MRMADPLDQSSADTQNQTPKQKQSKVEDTDQVPLFPRSLFQRFEPQNGGACVLRPASSPTFHSFLDHDSDDDKHDAVLKHKPTHKVDLQESPAPKQSKGNFDWPYSTMQLKLQLRLYVLSRSRLQKSNPSRCLRSLRWSKISLKW